MASRIGVEFLRVLSGVDVDNRLFLDGGTISVFSHSIGAIYDTR
jgi:hypothetical protein